jgi:hypothetical protein
VKLFANIRRWLLRYWQRQPAAVVCNEATPPAIPPAVESPMPEKYNLSFEIRKTLTDGTPCHRVLIESNGLTLEETQAMQKELAPALLAFLDKDAPQGDSSTAGSGSPS